MDTLPLRAKKAVPRLEEALGVARSEAERLHNTGTGWTSDREMALYYEGREAALVYALNLLTGYRGDR